MTANVPIALAAGLGLLLLTRKRASAAPSVQDGETVAEAKERIVQESKEIIQGKRDAYSDKPGEKVSPREAAERVKDEVVNTGKVTTAAQDDLAIAAARAAQEQAARDAVKPTGTVTAGPIGVSVQVKQAQQWLNYLGAGLKVDGKYGPNTRAAWGKAANARGKLTRFDRASATTAMVDPDARAAIMRDASAAKDARARKPAPVVVVQQPSGQQSTQPVVVVQQPSEPAGPQPPEGFDRAKAANSAPDVARNIRAKQYSYSRPALKIWQKLAGIAQDGVYGKGSAAAMRYYVGPSAPKPLFAQGVDHYPWGD